MEYKLIAAQRTKEGYSLLVEHHPVWWEGFLGKKKERKEYLALAGRWHELPTMKLCPRNMERILSDFQARIE